MISHDDQWNWSKLVGAFSVYFVSQGNSSSLHKILAFIPPANIRRIRNKLMCERSRSILRQIAAGDIAASCVWCLYTTDFLFTI